MDHLPDQMSAKEDQSFKKRKTMIYFDIEQTIKPGMSFMETPVVEG